MDKYEYDLDISNLLCLTGPQHGLQADKLEFNGRVHYI